MNGSQTVPKSITRQSDEWNGLPIKFILMVFLTAIISLLLIAGTLTARTVAGRIVFLCILLAVLFLFFKFLRSPQLMNRSWLMYLFFLRAIRGKTITAKFTLPDGFMERIIPLKAFHSEGLIEFIGNQYGLLMRIEPSRISDDELENHVEKVKSLVDSLHGNLMMKLFVCSIPQSNVKQLERNIIATINSQPRTDEQKAHLYSLYHHTHNNNSSVIQWRFYVFVSLGYYESLQKAMIAKQQYFPGISSRLQKCGVFAVQIQNKNELGMAYRQCITQQGYL